MTSFTISLTGNSSQLSSSFFPDIVLDDRYTYSCGLLDFTAYQSIPNVTVKNNEIHIYRSVGGVVDVKLTESPKKDSTNNDICPPELVEKSPKKFVYSIKIPEG